MFNCHRCQVINSQNKCNPNEYTYKVRGLDTNGQRVVHCDGQYSSLDFFCFVVFCNVSIVSGNKVGTCQRSLCECDLAFAHELAAELQNDKYQEKNSKWKGKKLFDQK